MKKASVLITGSSGFIGRFLVNYLIERNINCRCLTRKLPPSKNKAIEYFTYNELSNSVGWNKLFKNCYAVIHLAGLAHIPTSKMIINSDYVNYVNTTMTIDLAKQAIKCGVKKFIYISSAKVCGEYTRPGKNFSPNSKYNPKDQYARSKANTEKVLLNITKKTKMKVTIIRPPLVYGPNSKANFKSLVTFINLKLPVPLGYFDNNLRSFVSVHNLSDFILTCLKKKTPSDVYMVSDGKDISTKTLVYKIAKARGVKVKFLMVPQHLIYKILKFFNLKSFYNKLSLNFQVDIRSNKKNLSWDPPLSIDQALKIYLK
jgi:nucleoside-diphosphate-sugar epimerase